MNLSFASSGFINQYVANNFSLQLWIAVKIESISSISCAACGTPQKCKLLSISILKLLQFISVCVPANMWKDDYCGLPPPAARPHGGRWPHSGRWPFALATTPAHNVMSVCITASGPGMSLQDCESVRENSVCSASQCQHWLFCVFKPAYLDGCVFVVSRNRHQRC